MGKLHIYVDGSCLENRNVDSSTRAGWGFCVIEGDSGVGNGKGSLIYEKCGLVETQRDSELFIGAEGTLGIITAAVLRLFPSPRETQTAFIAVQGIQAACDLLDQMQVRSNGMVDAFELISDTALDLVLTHIPKTANPLTNSYPWYVAWVKN